MAKQTKGKDMPTGASVGTPRGILAGAQAPRDAAPRSSGQPSRWWTNSAMNVGPFATRSNVPWSRRARSSTTFPRRMRPSWAWALLDLDPQAVHAAYDRLAMPYHAQPPWKVVRELDMQRHRGPCAHVWLQQTPALMRLFLDGTFAFVADFRSMLASYLEYIPKSAPAATNSRLPRGEPGGVGGARGGEVRARARPRILSAACRSADEVEAIGEKCTRQASRTCSEVESDGGQGKPSRQSGSGELWDGARGCQRGAVARESSGRHGKSRSRCFP